MSARSRPRKARKLNQASLGTLARLLSDQGLSEEQVESGLDYACSLGARSMREGFELAMSRAIFSDAELEAGKRYDVMERLQGQQQAQAEPTRL